MFSQTIIDLAKQFNETQGANYFALHDALCEEGFEDLAKHFEIRSPHSGGDRFCAHAEALEKNNPAGVGQYKSVKERMEK